jgi:hypothetical protein
MKRFIVPLQGFAALLLCSGMAWMVFVLATVNPTPPTAKDLQARSTQDLSFVSMNSTAVALAKQMLVDMAPSEVGPIFLPVSTGETATPGPASAVTLRPADIYVNTSTPYKPYLSPTPSPTRRKQDTAVPPSTSVPSTRTSRPPATNVPNTKPPADTPVPTHPATVTSRPTDAEPPTPVPQPTQEKPTATSQPYP